MSQPMQSQRTNGMAVTGFILSLIGFNIIAAILGHVAMGQIKRTGEGGNGLAIAAVVLGWLSFVSIIFWFLVIGAAFA